MTGPLGKCSPCLDRVIGEAGRRNVPVALASVPDGVVLLTQLMNFAIGGQQVTAPAIVALCLDCRKAQLDSVSKAGLVVA